MAHVGCQGLSPQDIIVPQEELPACLLSNKSPTNTVSFSSPIVPVQPDLRPQISAEKECFWKPYKAAFTCPTTVLLSYEIRHESTTVNKDSSLLWCPGSPHESSTITLGLQDSEWSCAVWELDMYLLKLTLINTHHFLTGFNFIRKMISAAATAPVSLRRKLRVDGIQLLSVPGSPGSSSELQAAFQCKAFHSTFPIFLWGSENFNVLLFRSFESISG